MTTKISTANLDSSITTLIVSGSGPKVTAITYPGNDLAADPAGGQTITLTGTGFVTGCSVFVGTTQASVVTFISATSVTFTAPALAAATYTLYLVNPDGGTATIVPGISYSGTPIWSTTAGTLGSVYEYSPISNATTATGDGSISYSVFSGTLPTGSSLNTSTGVITGTSPASAGATTYTFVIRATDAQLQDTDRTFSITVNTDAVTWTTPAANSTVTLGQSLASTTTLLATSAAGKAITYTANTLPTGMSISGATVTGTPTVVGNTTSTFTATAATTNRTATAIINWTVSVSGDTYFPYTTLLLSGAVATETFVADASANNFALAVAGDTKPNNFNPYTPGYYSNYFDGSGDYLTVPGNAAFVFGTDDFTIELWFYIPGGITAPLGIIGNGTGGIDNAYWSLEGVAGGNIAFFAPNSATQYFATTTQPWTSGWAHIAVSRAGANTKLFLNGVQQGSTYTTNNSFISGGNLYIGTSSYSPGSRMMPAGYISNVRVVKGTAVYTGNFAVPTAPLTATQAGNGATISAISGSATSLLTCQSNRFLDNSTNLFAVTRTGDTSVQSFNPFVPNTAYAAYGSTYFDGTGDYLVTPSSSAFNFGTGDFQIEAWVYLFNVTDRRFIYGTGGTGQQNQFWIETDRKVGYYDGTADRYSTGTIQLNSWNQVALARSGSTCTFYVNGVASGTFTSSASLGATSQAYIGRRSDALYEVAGYISDLRILKGVTSAPSGNPTSPLSAITGTSLLTCQTNQPANNSVFLDSSTNALAVTRVGNTSAGTFTPYGANWSVYQSDVLSDQLGFTTSVGTSFQFTGNFTIEGWVYYTTLSGDASFYVISDGSTYLAFNISMSAGVYNIYLNSGSATSSFAHGISVRVWTHVAMVRSGSTVTLYTNGVSKGTITNSNTLGYSAPSINRTGGGVSGVIRYISNVRIVKGTAVYTGNFTPSTTPLTAIANTVLLTFQSNRFVDNSTNAFAVTITGNVAVQRFSPFSPSAAYTAGTISGSAYFDGTGDYLTTPSSSLFNLNGINWTVEGWFNLVSATSDDRLFVFAGASVSWGFYRRAATGNIYFGQMGSDEALLGNMLLNEWTHLALVRTSGPTISLYKNGVFSASTAAYSMPNENCTFLIAGNPAPYANTVTKGYVSDVRVVKGTAVYTSAFTPPAAPLTAVTNTSLLLNMTSAGIYDATMINSLETVGDAKILSTQTPYAGSYYSNYFSGTTSFSTPNQAGFNLGTGNFTIEAWVFSISAGTTYGQQVIGKSGGSTGWALLVNRTLNNYGVIVTNADGTALGVYNSTLLPINQWAHIAWVRSSGTAYLYVNGTLISSAADTTNDTNTNTLWVGSQANNGSDQNFPGYISNVRIVKGTAVYTSNFTPPTTPLTAIANTSFLTCQSNRFIDNSTNAFALTVSGSPSVQSFNPFQRNSAKTMSFDGTGDYLYSIANQTNNFGTGNFTVECWVYFSSVGNGQLVAAGSGTNTNAYYWQYYSSQLQFGIQNVGSITVTSWTPIANAWYHIAVVRSGTNVYQFVNGTQLGSTVTSSQNFVDGPTYVGYGGAGYLNGYINDLRITKGVARYTSTFTPPTTAFIAR